MKQFEWINFQNNYINEMIQAEKELEKIVFYNNMSTTEKAIKNWSMMISKKMAKEIDRDIINGLFKISQSGNTMNVSMMLKPAIQSINLNFIISPEGVTFDK